MTTVLDIYGFRKATGFISKHGETDLPMPNWLVGLELEIEGFNPSMRQAFGGFRFEHDGSLRAQAGSISIEAITAPVAIKYVPNLLSAFYKHFGVKEEAYSERCSTHVHFDVQTLTVDQISTICLVYQTVERLLFQYVGQDRDKSIFCVPWCQSNLSYNIVNKLSKEGGHDGFRRWQKYSALNLIPVSSQGTLEFRHLYGTCDVEIITEWISIIAKMVEYALATPLEEAKESIIKMNTVSNYQQWLTQVFGSLAGALQGPATERELARGVIDTKLMLTESNAWTPPKFTIRTEPTYAEIVNQANNERDNALRRGARIVPDLNAMWATAGTTTAQPPAPIVTVDWPQINADFVNRVNLDEQGSF